MKTVIAAIGALALAASAAQAADVSATHREPAQASRTVVWNGPAAHRWRAEPFRPSDWATNRGAGTTRSSDANDG